MASCVPRDKREMQAPPGPWLLPGGGKTCQEINLLLDWLIFKTDSSQLWWAGDLLEPCFKMKCREWAEAQLRGRVFS